MYCVGEYKGGLNLGQPVEISRNPFRCTIANLLDLVLVISGLVAT